MGMPDHHFHALIAQERIESLRSTMLASRRRRRRDEHKRDEAGPTALPRLSLHGYATARLTRRPA